jgi:hypothetical protein
VPNRDAGRHFAQELKRYFNNLCRMSAFVIDKSAPR